jgi:hypothetical protein
MDTLYFPKNHFFYLFLFICFHVVTSSTIGLILPSMLMSEAISSLQVSQIKVCVHFFFIHKKSNLSRTVVMLHELHFVK